MPDRLLTARFLTMCAYSFTVFVSLFQLLPTAPYHIMDLGGSTAVAGLFLGLLTYASALSAPVTGVIGDRVGQRRVLITVSVVLAICATSYAFITNYKLLFAIVVVHGVFWSGLLSASGAYMSVTIPASRRAEGLGYWGLASVFSVATAPAIGFWVYRHGWALLCAELAVLNLLMALIAWRLPDDRYHPGDLRPAGPPHAVARGAPSSHSVNPSNLSNLVEWRVLALTLAMALIAFGYGALTSFSALFADELHVAPRSLFLTVMAFAVLTGRLTLGRVLDRIGYRRVLLPCFVMPALGLALLGLAQGRVSFVLAALVFGSGFGLIYPSYTAYVLGHIAADRRGAAFGAMLAAFDTGVGSGSTVVGWIAHRFGFRLAFGFAALLAALSLPYFLAAEKRLGFRHDAL